MLSDAASVHHLAAVGCQDRKKIITNLHFTLVPNDTLEQEPFHDAYWLLYSEIRVFYHDCRSLLEEKKDVLLRKLRVDLVNIIFFPLFMATQVGTYDTLFNKPLHTVHPPFYPTVLLPLYILAQLKYHYPTYKVLPAMISPFRASRPDKSKIDWEKIIKSYPTRQNVLWKVLHYILYEKKSFSVHQGWVSYRDIFLSGWVVWLRLLEILQDFLYFLLQMQLYDVWEST